MERYDYIALGTGNKPRGLFKSVNGVENDLYIQLTSDKEWAQQGKGLIFSKTEIIPFSDSAFEVLEKIYMARVNVIRLCNEYVNKALRTSRIDHSDYALFLVELENIIPEG